MARYAGFERLGHTDNDWVCMPEDIETFAKLVTATERRELQGQLDAMHALYELACRQRDFLMDQQRAELFAERGKLQ